MITINSQAIEQHYHADNVLHIILNGLQAAGKNIEQLLPSDLLSVDAFHIRGREATIELAESANLLPGQRVLDVGCALGGSARFLAEQFGCSVEGIDITQSYIDAATDLSRRAGFANKVSFQQASALALPFDDACFDAVWTEHVQMNIADKLGFYREIARVLKPGGQLLFHDVFQGTNRQLHYPVPWAESAAINHLITPDDAREIIAQCGLEIIDWQDKTAKSFKWLEARRAKQQTPGVNAIGLHLLMGDNMPRKISNLVRNIEQDNIVIAQCLLKRIC